MTVEEKCAQLAGVWFAELATDNDLDATKLEHALAHGIGQISPHLGPDRPRPGGHRRRWPTGSSATWSRRPASGSPRSSTRSRPAGSAPARPPSSRTGPGSSATWDPDLAEEVAEVIGRQLRAVGARLTLAPVVDVARDPRWGRVEETYGEDPELASRFGVAYVRGVQSQGVACTLKHYVGYGASEGGLNWGWVSAGPRHLRDVLAAPFRAAIAEAGVGAVMPSYNDVDGLPVHGSPELLTDLLRDELGFTGVTVADYFGVDLLATSTTWPRTRPTPARQALLAGLDVELPAYDCYRTLPGQVEAGTVPIEAIDAACRRVLTQKVELGLFDDPYVDAGAATATFDTPEDRALARRAVAESVVVLANDGTLPLAAGRRVAVLGPSADDARLLMGDYHFPAHLELAAAHLAPQGERVEDLLPQNPTPTPLEALRERVEVVDDLAERRRGRRVRRRAQRPAPGGHLRRDAGHHRPPPPARPAGPDRGGRRHRDAGRGGRHRRAGPRAQRGRAATPPRSCCCGCRAKRAGTGWPTCSPGRSMPRAACRSASCAARARSAPASAPTTAGARA